MNESSEDINTFNNHITEAIIKPMNLKVNEHLTICLSTNVSQYYLYILHDLQNDTKGSRVKFGHLYSIS
jgi:hypothetical protein